MNRIAVASIAVVAFSLGAASGREFPQEVLDAVTAAPNLYAVGYEDDVIRILRVEYGAGERSPMHHHPASCSIIINSQIWESMNPDGELNPTFADAGMFACEDGYTHGMENTGEEPAGVFIIEFKGTDELPGG